MMKNNSENLAAILAEGLAEMHLTLPEPDQQQLLRFMLFLKKWNQHFNLTAITDLTQMLSYHLLDSLSIVPYIQGDKILDFGSGAGFPGVPLAVYYPQKQWFLVDSNGKKTRFLTQLKSELNLLNVQVIQERAENWETHDRFSQIVCRAVSSVKDILTKTDHLLPPNGQWLLMKGEHEHEDLEQIPYPFVIHQLQIPGVRTLRYLILITKTGLEPVI